jgi:hypothetical protein
MGTGFERLGMGSTVGFCVESDELKVKSLSVYLRLHLFYN